MKRLHAVFIFLSIIVMVYPVSSVQGAEPDAEVSVESLDVHSAMSAGSEVVKELKRGDRVTVEFEMSRDDEKWCGISEGEDEDIAGYVQCSALDREEQGVQWRKVGERAVKNPADTRAAARSQRDAKGQGSVYKRPVHDINVVMYYADW